LFDLCPRHFQLVDHRPPACRSTHDDTSNLLRERRKVGRWPSQ
jgi:hypothetical protein